ncbi:MAG: hypothetical protein GQ477_06025 [Nanohaloarchaea archaeon]|nr:hypothetical protein [Candidatus Nanohaloarchaea archaeon]
MDDEDIKKLNPSINYDNPNQDDFIDDELLVKTYLRNKENIQNNKTVDDDTFYKYFSLIIMVIFMIIILNITFSAYQAIDPTAFDSCKSVISDDIVDVYSSVDNVDSAERVLIQWNPTDYTFTKSQIENCGRNGLFAYYFDAGNETYIVCEDETIQYFETICKEPRFMTKMFIGFVKIFN